MPKPKSKRKPKLCQQACKADPKEKIVFKLLTLQKNGTTTKIVDRMIASSCERLKIIEKAVVYVSQTTYQKRSIWPLLDACCFNVLQPQIGRYLFPNGGCWLCVLCAARCRR